MTIKDIAKESGYSVSTVSRVLNQHRDVSPIAREKIEAIVAAHNFVPNDNAKHLKQQMSKSIAVLVKGTSNMLFANIIEHLQNLIEKSDYSVFIYYMDEYDDEVEEALRLCREKKPLGILFLGGNPPCFKGKFERVNVPCVLVTTVIPTEEFKNLSCVGTDDVEAAKSAIDTLIALGHEKIGIIGGDLDVSYTSLQRYNGCIKSFDEHQIAFEQGQQYEVSRFTYDSSYRAMKRLIEKNKEITAIFAMSDVTAIGAIRALRDYGLRVPEDISVMGFDGIELGQYYSPRLTTIRQQYEQIAENSVEILLNCIERNARPMCNITSYAVIEGESVCKL